MKKNVIYYIKKNIFIVLMLISLCPVLAISYAKFTINSESYRSNEMYISELLYSVKIDNENTYTIDIEPGETEHTIEITSLNAISTNYKLAYLNNDYLVVKYASDYLEPSYGGIVTTRAISLTVKNTSTTNQTLSLSVFGGYSFNEVEKIDILDTYTEINLEYYHTDYETTALYVDNTRTDSLDKSADYTLVSYTCSNDATVTYDNDNKKITVDADKQTKCSLYFEEKPYTITFNMENITLNDTSTVMSMKRSETKEIYIKDDPVNDYIIPETISVTGADYTYDTGRAKITLTNPTSNITITGAADKLSKMTSDISSLFTYNTSTKTYDVDLTKNKYIRTNSYRNDSIYNISNTVGSPSRIYGNFYSLGEIDISGLNEIYFSGILNNAQIIKDSGSTHTITINNAGNILISNIFSTSNSNTILSINNYGNKLMFRDNDFENTDVVLTINGETDNSIIEINTTTFSNMLISGNINGSVIINSGDFSNSTFGTSSTPIVINGNLILNDFSAQNNSMEIYVTGGYFNNATGTIINDCSKQSNKMCVITDINS